MTADAQGSRAPHPLDAGASPALIRRWLAPSDADRFVAEYGTALDTARSSLELGGVLAVVERWRQIAILQTDPVAYRRTVRLAAELATGEPSPDDEPLEITAAKAGFWDVYVVETVGEDVDASVNALPADLIAPFAELRTALEVSPWTVGKPLVPSNPTGLRVVGFGPDGSGQMVYMVVERERRALIVQVTFV